MALEDKKAFLAILVSMDLQALQEHLVIRAQLGKQVLAERGEIWDH